MEASDPGTLDKLTEINWTSEDSELRKSGFENWSVNFYKVVPGFCLNWAPPFSQVL